MTSRCSYNQSFQGKNQGKLQGNGKLKLVLYGAAAEKLGYSCMQTSAVGLPFWFKNGPKIFKGTHPQMPLAVAYLSTYHSNSTTSHLVATAIYGNDIMADFQNCHIWYLQVVSLLSVYRKRLFLEFVVMGWRRVPEHNCSQSISLDDCCRAKQYVLYHIIKGCQVEGHMWKGGGGERGWGMTMLHTQDNTYMEEVNQVVENESTTANSLQIGGQL